jgi:hypothetical protein
LGAVATDDPAERGFLYSVEAEYFSAAIATDNHALAHSPRPTIVKGTRSGDSPLVTNPDESR